MKRLVIFLFLSYLCQGENEEDSSPYVIYENGASSERNLPLCGNPREACNEVRLRFWLPILVRRLCKCPDRTECPYEWESDKHTISINTRAQLKFCSPIKELPECTQEETASITVTSINNRTVKVNCYCPELRYFHLIRENHSVNEHHRYYKCKELEHCEEGEFCGHITKSSYETYHVCTCPSQNICIMKNRRTNNVLEFLYEGPAYRGYCTGYYSNSVE